MTNLTKRLPTLNALPVFEAAYRLGNFTHAADELRLSQASVSRRIRELEQDLGVRLFERRRYDVVPTTEGEAFAKTVRLSLNDLATAAEDLRSRGVGTRSLTIFSDISLSNALVAPVVGEFQRLHPNIQLQILASYEPIETVRQHFDVGLQYGRFAEHKFSVEPIADDVIFPVCAPEVAARLPSLIRPIDVAKQPLLHLKYVGRTWPDWRSFLAFFRLKEPEPIEGLQFNSYQVCLDVAEAGDGIALGWARSVKARIDAGKLVRIPGMTMPLVDSINVHRVKSAQANPIAEQFLSLLRARIEPVA